MAKTKYRFNPESIAYEKIEKNFKTRILVFLKYVASSLVLAAIIVSFFVSYFGSPTERALKRENQELLAQYERLNRDLNKVIVVLEDLEQRDDNIYRVVFEAEPIHSNIRRAGLGGVNRYEHLEYLTNSDLVISTSKKLDQLSRSIYVQSKSYDEVEKMCQNKADLLAAIPAIMPISIKDLNRISAGYGWRVHPIYKTRKFHQGMDFTGKIGTPLYATGDAVVKSVGSMSGYGRTIVLDHGYGYTTVYAHLNDYNVKEGQKVKRGEVVAFLGNSGKSTGPHLHYEIRKAGQTLDPVNYYFNDLSAEEYERMVAYANNTGQSMD